MDVLFKALGSLEVVETVAVFTANPAAEVLNVDALTLIVMTTTLPTFTDQSEQLTVPDDCVQVPCVVETEANVTCVGRESLTVTP